MWTGVGFATLMLMGVSACALLHGDSSKSSHHAPTAAFNPALLAPVTGARPIAMRTRPRFFPGFLPGLRGYPKSSPIMSAKAGESVAMVDAKGVSNMNPLMEWSGLPLFEKIEPVHVEPAMHTILASLKEDFKKTEEGISSAPSTYDAIVEPFEAMEFPLGYSWGAVSHLNGVKNSDALREVYQKVQPEIVMTSMAIAQSIPVYKATAKLEDKALTESQRRVVESKLRAMRHAGVDLEGATKEEFNQANIRLSELATKFTNNLMDATKAFELVLKDKADAAGLPDSALEFAAQDFMRANPDSKATPESGPWRLTLDMPSYLPAMKYLESSDVRKKLYYAFATRASSGDLDNQPLVFEILQLRDKMAKMLGFSNYAEQSLVAKMAEDVNAVDALNSKLFDTARPAAERELAELRTFAASQGYTGDLKLWDTTYWSERLKKEKFSYDEEALRPYFALPKVLDGMFGIASKLFGVEVTRDDAGAERWDPSVMFFRVVDQESQKHIASFFLDPYARPGEKNGGAWMQPFIGKSKVLDKKPVAFLTCNGSPPVGDKPSLMTFRDAETLFHEFGHGLQHMLTNVEEADAAGINNIEWDVVELPSQFMENWLYHKPTVDSFAIHHETGEPLPADVFDKIKGARTFMAGSMLLRQLQVGATDMELYARYDPSAAGETPKGPLNVQRAMAAKYAVIDPLEEDRFLCSFAHIFAGGYGAGYYSYVWAEVLSADAFAAFEDAGLDNDEALAATGRRFRKTVLGSGGSRHPSAVYKEFRGHDATPDALLRHKGLLTA